MAAFRYEMLPTTTLELDTTNPRIRKWIEMYGPNPTPEQIHLALGVGTADTESSSTTFASLRESIKTNRGLINPIIVNRHPDGKSIVVEGNTRVAIYRSFIEDNVPGPWETIPALVHEGLAQIEIDAIRLQAHLVGPRPWDPYSKAKYLHHLRNVDNVPFNQLVDLCGGRRKELQDYIDAYADMERHYRKVIQEDGAFDATRFSAFVELQKPAVKQALMKNDFTLDEFARWVDQRLIDPLNTVRLLPRILAHPEARDVFLEDGAKEAAKLIDLPPSAPAQALSLEDLARTLSQKINQLSWKEVERLKDNPTHSLAEHLFELEETVRDICKKIRDEEV
ncbi:hypothetical protein C7410_103279 [Paraburkholderia silvatlantica]|uniref:Uncharacterized protein n=1 Tax=Paraburkholderia silvatlantica TaxID=321895 RepID=A0A2V4UE57_9BURK|nr:ParB/Srx family N-terminal domain-containing protein [Paraburkholderia silvatlantica]PYE26360.1 hypothetical protein C7410_103279 [Paraburkholderia silvatlantica]